MPEALVGLTIERDEAKLRQTHHAFWLDAFREDALQMQVVPASYDRHVPYDANTMLLYI